MEIWGKSRNVLLFSCQGEWRDEDEDEDEEDEDEEEENGDGDGGWADGLVEEGKRNGGVD